MNNIEKNEFGIRLKQIRTLHQVKQTEIAEYLDVTRSYVSGVETGSLSPGLSFIIGTKQFFSNRGDNRSYDWWIDGIDQKAQNSENEASSREIDQLKLLLREKESQLKDKERIISLMEQLSKR